MDSAMGKGYSTPIFLPPEKKAGTFLGPEALSAARQPGLRGLFSRRAELHTALALWCVVPRQNGPDASPPLLLSFRGVLQLEVRYGVSNVRLSSAQLSFQKADFSEVINPPAIAEFTPFIADTASLRPLPPGPGRKEQGPRPAGAGYGPGIGRREIAAVKAQGRGDRLTQFSCGRLELASGGRHLGSSGNDALAGERPCDPSVSRRASTPPGPWSKRRSSHALGLSTPIHKSPRFTEPRACQFLSPLPLNLHVLTPVLNPTSGRLQA